MAQVVVLPQAIPRETKAIRKLIDIGHMLRPRGLLGWVFLVGGGVFLFVVLLVAVANPAKITEPPMPAMLISSLVETAVGALLVWTVRAKKRTRLRALTHGTLEQGRVIGHGTRIGLALILRRLDTVIHYEVKADRRAYRGSFRSPMPGLRKHFGIGKPLQVLLDRETGAIWAPAEMDKTIEL